jgi:hypothetical protein
MRITEGAFTGYLHLNALGEMRRHDLDFPLVQIKPGSERFSPEGELVFPRVKEKGVPLSLVISSDGNALMMQ